MTEKAFRKVYPLIAGWIKRTLAEHASAARPVASLGLTRLPHHYDEKTLASSMVVFVPKVPMPPLSAMGFDQFRDFEQGIPLLQFESRKSRSGIDIDHRIQVRALP